MADIESVVNDRYAIYNANCMHVLPSIPDASVHLSVYSPPFVNSSGGLYHYSSSPEDLSNSRNLKEFLKHYRFIVKEIARVTLPGRMTCVHAMDVPAGNTGRDHMIDFPGFIKRVHKSCGFQYCGFHAIWKEPLAVRNRTLAKSLAHMTIVQDSVYAGLAAADVLLLFRKKGRNPIPVSHPVGLLDYAGEREMPHEVRGLRGFKGDQKKNGFSHWIWRQYASPFWDDIRIDRVLPFIQSRDEQDEKHVHPLQMDVVERCVVLRSNPGETVLTPFMGIGSEVYVPVQLGRRGIGIELKPSYYRQAVKNLEAVDVREDDQPTLPLHPLEVTA